MSYEVHFISEFIMDTGFVAAIKGLNPQVVSRFERTLRFNDLPQPGVVYRGIAPVDFHPNEMVYDVEDDRYVITSQFGVCHAKGDCVCQQQIKTYMQDERWTMLYVEVQPTPAEDQDG